MSNQINEISQNSQNSQISHISQNNQSIPSIQVYIIHSSLMDVRKQRMEALEKMLKSCKKATYTLEFVSEYDPNTIKQEDIKKIDITKKNSGELYDTLVKNMHINQISNVLKHAIAIEKASKSSSDFCVILEDDVLHGDDVHDKLADIVKHCQKNEEMQMLFLGLPSFTPIDESGGPTFKKTSEFYKLFPCCDSYMATPRIFAQLASNIYPMKHTTHIMLSQLTSTLGINTYMTTPNLFLDGSKFGAYLSSVDPNSKLIFNPAYNKLSMMVQKNSYTADEEKEIEQAFAGIKFQNHPDVMHIHAIFLMVKKEFKKAEAILDSVFTILSQNGCIINSETESVRTHMRLYRFLQTV